MTLAAAAPPTTRDGKLSFWTMVLTAAMEGLSLGRGLKGELKEIIYISHLLVDFYMGFFNFNLGAREGGRGELLNVEEGLLTREFRQGRGICKSHTKL